MHRRTTGHSGSATSSCSEADRVTGEPGTAYCERAVPLALRFVRVGWRRRARRTFAQWSPGPWAGGTRTAPRIVHCSHHKVGTVWFTQSLRSVAVVYGLTFARGAAAGVGDADVVVYPHSRDFDPRDLRDRPFSGTHMIRDPRDIVVSGYFYHLWTDEPWAHVPRDEYGGATYQQHLRSLSEDDGISAEIRRASSGSLRDMADWTYTRPEFLELRYEDVIGNERETFRGIFVHHGFGPTAAEKAADLCDQYSFAKMTKRPVGSVEESSHRRSGKPGQWADLFRNEHRELFEGLNPGLVDRLGYRWDQ